MLKKLFPLVCALLIFGCCCCQLSLPDDIEAISKAAATGEISYCDKAESGEMQAACYGVVAAKKNDITLCDKLYTVPLKPPKYREKITRAYARDMCISAVAQAKGDPSLCESIVDSELKESCKK